MGTPVTIVEAPFVWPKWDERRRQLFLRSVKQEVAKVTQEPAVKVSLSQPLDQPERVRCTCGCDHFKINAEGQWTGQSQSVINSVECERCHEIYVLEIAR